MNNYSEQLNSLIEVLRLNNTSLNSLIHAYNGNQVIMNNILTLMSGDMTRRRVMASTGDDISQNNVQNNVQNSNADISLTYQYDLSGSQESNASLRALLGILSMASPSQRTTTNTIRIPIVQNFNSDMTSDQRLPYDIISYDNFCDVENPLNDTCPITHERFYENYSVYQIRRCRHLFNPSSIQRWIGLDT